MMKFGIFSSKSFSIKTILCVLLVVAGFCLTSFFMMLVLYVSNPESVFSGQMPILSGQLLRIIQTVQSFFVFILPALLFAWLADKNPTGYLYFEKKNKTLVIMLVVIASLVVIPFINRLAYINEQMTFPDFLSGLEHRIRKSEKTLQETMNVMLQMDSPVILLYNIFLFGVLAAVGEELLFRGVIQRLIADASKNVHIGIWAAGFIFSAIHFQFFDGFFPRLLLGAWFGYLLYWSKSLWLPILAHFVNNATAVVISYMQQCGVIDSQADTIGKDDMILSGISIIVFGIVTLAIYKFAKCENDD